MDLAASMNDPVHPFSLSSITSDTCDDFRAIASFSVFSEEKCRNVLVRYCAHIPRNYQYKDGIQLVFLVLRDHLGDEELGRAGGVLYEMIEVDCQHTDDKGAAFQRWRYDHMNRHADLELPHVPHLTTVTSAIEPTAALMHWRRQHPHRYSTHLSDHSNSSSISCSSASCIRSRKSWMIDFTMYVSSKDSSTRPYRRVHAKEYHEMHWKSEQTENFGSFGQPPVKSRPHLVNPEVVSVPRDWTDNIATRKFSCRSPLAILKRWIHLQVLRKKEKLREGLPDNSTEAPREPNHDSSSRSRSWQNLHRTKDHPLVPEREIPNAIFARKFGLFTDGNALPPSIKELPVAEDKAVDAVAESAVRELMYSWRFRGPFTPQLWFDSALDHRKLR